jgi:hypothetical protein
MEDMRGWDGRQERLGWKAREIGMKDRSSRDKNRRCRDERQERDG